MRDKSKFCGICGMRDNPTFCIESSFDWILAGMLTITLVLVGACGGLLVGQGQEFKAKIERRELEKKFNSADAMRVMELIIRINREQLEREIVKDESHE